MHTYQSRSAPYVASQHVKHFTRVVSFNSHNNSMSSGLLVLKKKKKLRLGEISILIMESQSLAKAKWFAWDYAANEIKRRLLLGRKVTTNLGSILKSRDITLPTKVRIVKAMVFPVVMYGCESWTIKKAEHWGIDAFELWCWRRLLRVPWTARRSNQSILKEISPGCSLEGLMLKLKL